MDDDCYQQGIALSHYNFCPLHCTDFIFVYSQHMKIGRKDAELFSMKLSMLCMDS